MGYVIAMSVLAGLVVGVIAGLYAGVSSRHRCLDCGLGLLRFCAPGHGCRRNRVAAVSANGAAIADAQLRDGRTQP